jgi:mono/diheme cytochrome c family protein
MIRRVFFVAIAGLVLGGAATAQAQDAAAIEKGKKVYAEAMPKCKTCHSIAGEGNAKGPLDEVGSKLTAEEIKGWIRTPKEMTEKTKSTRKPPMMAYPKEKMSDADLEALTAYMLSLKKK